MLNINIDIGVSECIKTIELIASRRTARKDNFLSNLEDDVDALVEIIKALDNIFIALVRGFANQELTDDQIALSAHLEETMKYLSNRQLLPNLQTLNAEIETIGSEKIVQKNSALSANLNALHDMIDRYRERLGSGCITGVAQTQEWNLMTLWEQAQGFSDNNDVTLKQMANQVHQNQDFSLSDAIHKAAGKVRGLCKSENIF